MPGAHRDADLRFCTALTTVIGQNNVFVNGKLWAVENDPETHGHGELIAVTGQRNVYINRKLVICAVGDKAYPDDAMHPYPPTDPQQHSDNVFVYDGGSGNIYGLVSDTGIMIVSDSGEQIYV